MLWEKKPRTVVPQKPEPQPAPPTRVKLETPMNEITTPPTIPSAASQRTIVGRTAVVRGQFSGDEDLNIEGQFEGTISLADHCLTVGAEGQVKAEVHARHVVVLGTMTGNISARDKIEIRRTGHVVGDLIAASVAIEEGAYFKGSIEIRREEAQGSSGTVTVPSAMETGA